MSGIVQFSTTVQRDLKQELLEYLRLHGHNSQENACMVLQVAERLGGRVDPHGLSDALKHWYGLGYVGMASVPLHDMDVDETTFVWALRSSERSQSKQKSATPQSKDSPNAQFGTRSDNYCLVIDMIKSTEYLLNFSTTDFHRFGWAMSDQMTTDWIGLEMPPQRSSDGNWNPDGSTLKFTGDGWMIFGAGSENLDRLLCLALIMAKRFQEDLARALVCNVSSIPKLRLCICQGPDALLQLPSFDFDFMSDSARRATRESERAWPNEILVDPAVQQLRDRDFSFVEMTEAEREARPKPKHSGREEVFRLYFLKGFTKAMDTTDLKSKYVAYTYTRLASDNTEVLQAGEKLAPKIISANDPNSRVYQGLIEGASSGEIATQLFNILETQGKPTGVDAYNARIRKQSTVDEALAVFREMNIKGQQPDRNTFMTLIEMVGSFDANDPVFNKMLSNQLTPDISIYNRLMKLCPDRATGMNLLNVMEATGVRADNFTYNILMTKP